MNNDHRAGTSTASVSQLLVLTIKRPQDEDSHFPTPSIPQAGPTELDLGGFDTDADATLDPWPLMAAEQLLYMSLEWNGGRIVLAEAHPVTAAEVGRPSSYTIQRASLLGIADGTQITVSAAVSFDGTSNPCDKVSFTGYIWHENVSGKAKLQMAAQNGRTIASVHFRTDYHGEQFVDNIHMLYG